MKLVKYCSVCEEGFAERFGFCPNCGGHLEAFEMKPVEPEAETKVETESFAEAVEPAPEAVATSAAVIPETLDFSGDDILELDSVDTRETAVTEENIEQKPETLAETAPAFSANEEVFQSETPYSQLEADDNEYHVTVVSQKASSWFAPFFLSLLAAGFVTLFGAYVAGILIQELNISGLGDSDFAYSFLTDDVPPITEEEEIIKGKEGGGGGGGGHENEDPASKGRTPNNTTNPRELMILERMNSDIKYNNAVENYRNDQDNGDRIGVGTADGTSGGRGKGGGLGDGNGLGFGNGEGTGEGNGKGKGRGNGEGEGIGNNRGNDLGNTEDGPTMEKPRNVGVTKGLNITSKPQARYTDAARQNNVQGSVTLRVTFNANGTIGSVSPVSSLPYGLTEQAISAAKQIRFEPQMKNGQAVTVVRQIQYSFTIY